MARSHINAARDRAFTRLLADYPGTLTFEGGSALDCAVVIGIEERETVDGGFSRVKSATVYIAKSELPTLPAMQDRTKVTLQPQDGTAETFRLFENHAQSENHWLLRCGQWGL